LHDFTRLLFHGLSDARFDGLDHILTVIRDHLPPGKGSVQ
jgi:hypothetical protein